jgi:hypothetical protein
MVAGKPAPPIRAGSQNGCAATATDGSKSATSSLASSSWLS